MNTLKETDGRYYQECEVVMLATKNKSNITRIYLDPDKTKSVLRANKTANDNYKEYINLYIISNEEIKKGDWCLDKNLQGVLCKVNLIYENGDVLLNNATRTNPLNFRKIIATTDETLYLTFNNGKTDLKFVLPKPSDSFISKYIEEYNKGNIISDVLVEYERCKVCQGTKRHIVSMFGEVDCNYCQKNEGYEKLYMEPRLKIDSNNTITIKKVKDSYSREEVYTLLYNAIGYGASLGETIETKDIDKWIEENL